MIIIPFRKGHSGEEFRGFWVGVGIWCIDIWHSFSWWIIMALTDRREADGSGALEPMSVRVPTVPTTT
jgi:hypothetical protein